MKRIFNVLLGTVIFIAAFYGVHGQVQKQPVPKKIPPPITKLADLGIADIIGDGYELNTVTVQILNAGPGDAGAFTVRLSIKQKGSTAKRYIEKRVSDLKAKGDDLLLTIKIGQPLKNLEIGVFVDSKNEIKESDEKNCGVFFPDGGTVSGHLSCDGF